MPKELQKVGEMNSQTYLVEFHTTWAWRPSRGQIVTMKSPGRNRHPTTI